jgi:hypothetical protein
MRHPAAERHQLGLFLAYFRLTGMTRYTGNTMVLRFLQTILSLGSIYHTNTNSYQTIPITGFTTDTLLRWVRWNINKFCVGFEMVYSFQDPHFVTSEHTRIMLMFLRCLQFSYAGGLIQKVGGCWRDIR